MVNSQNSEQIIKNLISNMEKRSSGTQNLSEQDIREKIKTVNKNDVIKKLNSMGLGSAAQMLKNMSDDDIIREISKNPAILKRLNSLLK